MKIKKKLLDLWLKTKQHVMRTRVVGVLWAKSDSHISSKLVLIYLKNKKKKKEKKRKEKKIEFWSRRNATILFRFDNKKGKCLCFLKNNKFINCICLSFEWNKWLRIWIFSVVHYFLCGCLKKKKK